MSQSSNNKSGAGKDKPGSHTKTTSNSGNRELIKDSSVWKRTTSSTAKKRFGDSQEQRKKEAGGWRHRLSGFTSTAFNIARKTTGGSIKVGKTILKNQEQLKVMVAAGESLRDLREVAGLTINEMSEAINLKDKSLLEAVENGTATLSFELILRLAALLARNDPIPFIIKYTRTYNPDVWRILNDWGLGRIPLHYERERKFINIYRRHDAARALSDDGFDKVLAFTNNAFEMALHFIAETENINIDKIDKNGQNEASKASGNHTRQADSKELWRKKDSDTESKK
jgi:transcriptional regulator with XRE-family HTH domain